MRERAPQKHIFSGLQIHLLVQSMQFPFITYGMALYRQYNDKMRASGASLENVSIFAY